MLEQYGRSNDIEISGIPDSAEQSSLEEKVVFVFSNIGVDVTSCDIEACRRIRKNRNNSRKTIVRFTNRKFAKEDIYNRKKLKSIDKSSLRLNNNNLFIDENLTPINNKVACNCRKLQRNNLISKTYTVNGTVHLKRDNIKNGKLVKVLHMKSFIYLFPDFEFDSQAINI